MSNTEPEAELDRSALAAGSLSLIAQDMSMIIDQLGGRTLRELAMIYGISDGRMHAAIRALERPLQRKGMVVCMPVRSEDYMYVFTTDLAVFIAHYLHRHDALATEMERNDRRIKTVNNGQSPLESVINSMDDFAEWAATLILAGSTTNP